MLSFHSYSNEKMVVRYCQLTNTISITSWVGAVFSLGYYCSMNGFSSLNMHSSTVIECDLLRLISCCIFVQHHRVKEARQRLAYRQIFPMLTICHKPQNLSFTFYTCNLRLFPISLMVKRSTCAPTYTVAV